MHTCRAREREEQTERAPEADPAADETQRGRVRVVYLVPEDVIGWEIWSVLVRSAVMRRIDAAAVSEERSLLGYTAQQISAKVTEDRLSADSARTLVQRLVAHYDGCAKREHGWVPPAKNAFGVEVNAVLKALSPPAPGSVLAPLRLPDGFETWTDLARRLAADGNEFAKDRVAEIESGARTTITKGQRETLIKIHARDLRVDASAGTRPGRSRSTLQPGAAPGEHDFMTQREKEY